MTTAIVIEGVLLMVFAVAWLGRLAVVWVIYVFAALVTGGAVARFPSVAVFLSFMAIIVVVLDAFVCQRSQECSSMHREEGSGSLEKDSPV